MKRKMVLLIAVGILGAVSVLYSSQVGQNDGPADKPGPIVRLGTLSGVVEAPKPFQAARIYARNLDNNILYMVYTRGGRYRAVNLFPGTYEVTVKKSGFAADVKTVIVKAGQKATVNLTLREAVTEAMQQAGFVGPPRAVGWDRKNVTLVPYDELWPPGPGRELVKKHCLRCHGLNFFPSRPASEAQWNAAIDLMSNPNMEVREVEIPPGTLNTEDRKTIVAYLAKHFGPGSPRRALRIESDAEIPLDESTLGRAMYIEFPVPLDPKLDANNTQRGVYAVSFDHEGNVWYTDLSRPNRVGQLTPRTAKFRDYVTPDPEATPHGLTVDNEGHVWWVDNLGFYLGRLDPKTGEMVRYYMDPKGEVPGGHGHTPVLDSRQNVWFSVVVGNRLGKWDRQTEKITLWEPPTPHSWPFGIVVDKNDNIWIAEFHGCKVAKFDPRTERFTEYPALTQPCTLARLGIDPQGTVWYGVSSAARLGKLDPHTGKMFEYAIPSPLSEPYDTWTDNQDNIWMSDGGYGGTLIRFDPRTEKFFYFPTPQTTRINKVEITREGAVWYGFASDKSSGVGVLYPDVTKMTTLAAYY
ncbi:MAG: carboxypeptidase regulatory-like domain-containing protein [Acidobacteria bacterium]|nr:carboxypeptidase regulatory-like domain-containing protein [Acidobacteriota bacterium]